MKKISLVFALLMFASLACGALDQAGTQVALTTTARTQSNVPVTGVTSTSGEASTAEPVATAKPVDTEVPPTETTAPAGQSRDNPISVGVAGDIGSDMNLTIVDIVRPADAVVKKGNQFNKKPEAGQEYLQANIEISCGKGSSDKCSFLTLSLKAVGDDGNVLTPEFVSGIDGQLETGEFFGGATKKGSLFYLVAKDDSKVVLFYDPIFGDQVYFSVAK